MTTSRSSWVFAIVLGAFLAPVTLVAQDTTSTSGERTHVVKEGDTLWDLARQYLGDPFLWPDIYRLNTDVVEDPHWIYPGERLRLPGGITPAEGTEVSAAPASSGGAGTVFVQQRLRTGGSGASRLGVLGRDARPVVRSGEYFAAPFVVEAGGPNDPGEILRSSEISGIARASERNRFQSQDPVFVQLPRNKMGIAGDRYLAYRNGPFLEGLGRVLIPTAIVVVDRANPGEATLAHIDQLFEEVKLGQHLIPLEPFPLTQIARPTAVERGPSAQVAWIQNEPILASMSHYVVLDAREADGVRIGDQYTLYTPRDRSGDPTLGARPVATLQVVRVTPQGTTAMIVDQVQPAIREGMSGRLTAKMP